jgi:hypothetical protein
MILEFGTSDQEAYLIDQSHKSIFAGKLSLIFSRYAVAAHELVIVTV